MPPFKKLSRTLARSKTFANDFTANDRPINFNMHLQNILVAAGSNTGNSAMFAAIHRASTDQGGGKRRSGDFATREKVRVCVMAPDSVEGGFIGSRDCAGVPRCPHDVRDQIINVAHDNGVLLR